MVSSTSETPHVMCTVVGDPGIGKTSMIRRFTGQSLSEKSETTVFENSAGTAKLDKDEVTVSVFDCSSQHDCEGLRHFAYKDSEIFILCYNVTDRKSFRNISNHWLPEIADFMGNKVATILVGLNIDERDTIGYDQDQPISREEGQQLSCALCCDDFRECSVLSAEETIQDIFKSAALYALKHRKKKSSLVKRIFRRSL